MRHISTVISDKVSPEHGFKPALEEKTYIEKTYVSVSDAAEMAKVTRQAILKRISLGQIPAHMVGAQWIIPAGVIRRTYKLA